MATAAAAALPKAESSGDLAPENPSPASRARDHAAKSRILISPGFRSVAAMAGWDEEAILLATLVVEDTPVRESRGRKRAVSVGRPSLKSPPSSGPDRKRRSQRRSRVPIPPVVLALDEDEKAQPKDLSREMEDAAVCNEQTTSEAVPVEEKQKANAPPCMDKLREELSCAICLDICFEPSTTPCGHSFCMKCLKNSAAKCGKRCPKCRQLISTGRSCTVNTVLWNTIQLLFPEEVEARRRSAPTESASPGKDAAKPSPARGNRVRMRSGSTSSSINNGGGSFIPASHLLRARRGSVELSQSEDAALAYRLQREEFREAFEREQYRNCLNSARVASIRAMTSSSRGRQAQR